MPSGRNKFGGERRRAAGLIGQQLHFSVNPCGWPFLWAGTLPRPASPIRFAYRYGSGLSRARFGEELFFGSQLSQGPHPLVGLPGCDILVVKDLFGGRRVEIITSHTNTDLDGLGAMTAAQILYPRARLVFPGTPGSAVTDFMSLHKNHLRIASPRDISLDRVTRLIVVDTQDRERLGALKGVLRNPGLDIHVYDHHPRGSGDLGGTLQVIEPLGSTSALLTRRLREDGARISPFEATVIALGIYSDTGSLLYPGTTPEDVAAVAWLLEQGANLRVISEFCQRNLSPEQQSILTQLVSSGRWHDVRGIKVRISRASTPEYVGGLAMISHRLRELDPADCQFLVVEMGDRVHLLGRSEVAGVNVSKILEEFGGGGHPEAAAAVVKGAIPDEIEGRLIKAIDREAGQAVRAVDIMVSPVKTISKDMSVADAEALMLRYGHSGLPVVDQEMKLCGVISRRDAEKAVRHGLGHAPVRAYMSRKTVTARPEATVDEIQRIMVERDIGRVPIVDGDLLIGIVTRTDLLRVLYGENFPRWHRTLHSGELSPNRRDLTHLLERVPAGVRSALAGAGEVARRLSTPCYAVGGFVRDLLLGYPNLDLDLVVEGDGLEFARALKDELGGELQEHLEFGTANLVILGGSAAGNLQVDVATARREYYEYAAALPVVEGATLREDLYRRDFTINAMAAELRPGGGLELIDFFGGEADLKKGLVRVLHNLSYVEDPTRILRGVRFEARYGFVMEEETLGFCLRAVGDGMLDRVSQERLREELILILSEPNAPEGCRRLAELGVLPAMFQGLNWSQADLNVLFEIRELLKTQAIPGLAEAVTTWIAYAAGLFHPADATLADPLVDRLKLSRSPARTLSLVLSRWRDAMHCLAAADIRPSGVCACLRDMPPEGLALIWAKIAEGPVRRRIIEFWTRFRRVRPVITGRDLLRAGHKPGPKFGEALKRVTAAKLDGLVNGREEELRLALQYLEDGR